MCFRVLLYRMGKKLTSEAQKLANFKSAAVRRWCTRQIEQAMDVATRFVDRFGSADRATRISGVAVAPVIVDLSIDGSAKFSLVLGKEKWGYNAGAWNFLGGAIHGEWPVHGEWSRVRVERTRAILNTAKQELWEEAGVRMSESQIEDHTFDVVYLRDPVRPGTASIVLMVRCRGGKDALSIPGLFGRMVTKRESASHRYPSTHRELSGARIFPMARRTGSSGRYIRNPMPDDCSAYVAKMWTPLGRKLRTGLHSNPLPTSASFKSTDG